MGVIESLFDFSWINSINAWISLITLIFLEIILGIDNIIFISILVTQLPKHMKDKARILGLILAMVTRILLLISIFWVMKLVTPLITIMEHNISGKDLILIGGGIFLIWKSTNEIHENIKNYNKNKDYKNNKVGFFSVLIQIVIIDIIFSLDSVITAVGMTEHLLIMIIAVVLSVIVMLCASKYISKFVDKYPTIKILALSFLILIGVTLIAEGLEFHIPKGYIYFAMAFSLSVESINIYISKNNKHK